MKVMQCICRDHSIPDTAVDVVEGSFGEIGFGGHHQDFYVRTSDENSPEVPLWPFSQHTEIAMEEAKKGESPSSSERVEGVVAHPSSVVVQASWWGAFQEEVGREV